MPANKPFRILLSALIFAAALYRYWPVASPQGPCGLGYESLEIGCSLARGTGFSNPFPVLPTGPSAHLAPLFPFLVSGLIKWFGEGPASSDAIEWLGSLVVAFQLCLWPWAAERLGMGFLAGFVAAAGWLLIGFTVLPMWEAAYVALLTLVLVVCMHRILTERVSVAFVALTGLLWGITFLFNPVPLLAYVAFLVGLTFFRRIPRAQLLSLTLVPFAVVSPWLVRNYLVFHHEILIRDNLGIELWSSNNPCSTYSFRDNRLAKCFNHPNENVAEAKNLQAVGEYAYNQEKLRESMAWIKNNPGKFVHLTRQRFLAFWLYVPGATYYADRRIPANIVLIWVVMALNPVGLWMLAKRNRNAALVCTVWLVLYPPVYYFIQFIPRYREPILWASLMPASFVLTEAARWIWQRARKQFPAASGSAETPEKLTV